MSAPPSRSVDAAAAEPIRHALEQHVAASQDLDLDRLVAGYAEHAELVTHDGETVRGRGPVVAWFEERGDFIRTLDLRPERIEIRPGHATLGWWGSLPSGQRLEGRNEFTVDGDGLITRQVVAAYGRTDRDAADVRVEITPPLLEIVLARPHKRNAVSQPMLHHMTTALRECASDDGLRAVVLSGDDPDFCAGEDVGGFYFPDEDTARRFLHVPLTFFEALETLPHPVVVAVQGHALGFGSEVLLVADTVVAHPGATFGFAEIDHGAVPSVLVTRGLGVVGRRSVLDLALTGRRFSADAAWDVGLVHRIHAHPAAAARETARELATYSQGSVAVTKGLLGADARDDHVRARGFMPAVLTGVKVRP